MDYRNVITRFLNENERLIVSEEQEMPLLIEAQQITTLDFLKDFLSTHSSQLKCDMAQYGAVLLRGFEINNDLDFEQSVLSIEGFKGISEAFMSEEGRIHVNDLRYVLFTNAVYKTGGTLYLGGFHSENYYSADVPAYICFCCHTPSLIGGETGLINMEKIYSELNDELKSKLEKQNFFVGKWLVSEVAKRYDLSCEQVEKLCEQFDLPIIGRGSHKFILMYKPSIFEHPITHKKSMQINLFEIQSLNREMRKHFMKDYSGTRWFWHRLVWRLPDRVLKILEYIYIMGASFFYSPKNALSIAFNKLKTLWAKKLNPSFNDTRVGDCFTQEEIKLLARLIRKNYSSFLWKKGDILLVDNRKVMHAGMPGTGPRLVRALIGNPLEMTYSCSLKGIIGCKDKAEESIGYYFINKTSPNEN